MLFHICVLQFPSHTFATTQRNAFCGENTKSDSGYSRGSLIELISFFIYFFALFCSFLILPLSLQRIKVHTRRVLIVQKDKSVLKCSWIFMWISYNHFIFHPLICSNPILNNTLYFIKHWGRKITNSEAMPMRPVNKYL